MVRLCLFVLFATLGTVGKAGIIIDLSRVVTVSQQRFLGPLGIGYESYSQTGSLNGFVVGDSSATDFYEVRSALLFDLSAYGGQSFHGVLKLNLTDLALSGTLGATQTLGIFEVTTPVATLLGVPPSTSASRTRDSTIFEDLGSGASFGQRVYSFADEPDIILSATDQRETITLDSSAFQNLDNGYLKLGIAVTTMRPLNLNSASMQSWVPNPIGNPGGSALDNRSQLLSFGTLEYTPTNLVWPAASLEITAVPEPTSLALVIIASVGLLVRRFRSKKQ